MMNRLIMVIMGAWALWGCSHLAVTSATQIGTDTQGFAVGQYSDSRSGTITGSTTGWWGGGGGGGHGGVGLGMMAFGWHTEPPPTQGDPLPFARAIATINYSRRLEQVKCDAGATGGISEYTFSDRPLRERRYQPFGHLQE
jgi:hypothetical protein